MWWMWWWIGCARLLGRVLLWLLVFSGLGWRNVYSQELRCEVRIDYSRVAEADPAYFRSLRQTIQEFLNGRTWTELRFESYERIVCQLTLQVEEVRGDVVRARAMIQAVRPVYNSTYTSPLFVYRDEKWQFTYTKGEQVQYTEGVYTSELSALLAYYAYVILGVYFDTFGPLGGTPFWQKAQAIVEMTYTSGGGEGWSPSDRKRQNRYWLVQWFLQPGSESFRQSLYLYHRHGLDRMADQAGEGLRNVLSALETWKKVYEEYPQHLGLRVVVDAKREELIGMFSGAPLRQRQQAYNLLIQIDPTHRQQYSKIIRS